ncbi:Calx-beta domain-containing protein [Actinoplanes regularis]|uniref:Calx-beta domain-containing protein n=1 Tax=Actinoplanes regularis TaxID=52697 RepID=UPI0024A33687|nr:Calx-beta domain-containing protein [Actinoplanes regularis]GLW32776.1 hypothetical protein Areg01_57140 [Actinoplanes regularis]
MRYRQAHAAKSGSVPFMLRGPKPLRTAISVVVAGAIGLVPVTFIPSPASADAGGHGAAEAVTAPALPTYTLTVTPNPVKEGPNAKVTVTAKLSAAATVATEIVIKTSPDSATPGADYDPDPDNATITIPIGATTADPADPATTIAIVDDLTKDKLDTESFTVTGIPTSGTTSNQAPPITVDITDAQSTPKLTLTGGGATAEGAKATFKVVSDTPSDLPVTVQWNSVAPTVTPGNGVATAGTDFTYPTNRTVELPVGAQVATIEIPIEVQTADDSSFEGDEDFAIELANPTNAVLGTPIMRAATIEDDDAAPTVEITPTDVTPEGNSGRRTQEFTAKLVGDAGVPLKLDWATVPLGPDYGNATAGKDYVAAHGQLAFPAGTTTRTFTVDIIGDIIDEGDGEDFAIMLSAVSGATSPNLGTPQRTITIVDDDAVPSVSFDDSAVKEGEDEHVVLLPIQLKGTTSDHPIQFGIAADAATSTASSTQDSMDAVTPIIGGYDYSLLNEVVTILPEQSSAQVAVLVNGDTMFEGNETVKLAATPGTNSNLLASAAPDPATLTLTNDDKAPDLKINDASGKEGDTVAVTGTVSGVSDSETTLTVTFAGKAAGGSRAADSADFTNPGAVVVKIPKGTEPGVLLVSDSAVGTVGTVQTIASLKLTADDQAEPNESIVVSGIGLGDVGTVTDGVVTIEGAGGAPGAPTLTAVPTTTVGVATVKFAGKATASSAVTLWGKAMGSTSFSKLRETTSDPNGNYSFSLALSRGFTLKTSVGETYSKEVIVKVQQKPTLTATSPSKDKVSITVTGDPKAAGSTVAVQSLVGGAWKTLYTGKLGTNGTYAKSITTTASTLTLRASVYGNSARGILFGTSATKKITVK